MILSNVLEQIAQWSTGLRPRPPGNEILAGTEFGDPRFAHPPGPQAGLSDTGWSKFQFDEVVRQTEPISKTRVQVREFKVNIHFMAHMDKRVAVQIKFKNSLEEGCLGVLTIRNAGPQSTTRSSSSIEATTPSASTRRVEIIVSDPVPHAGIKPGMTCASCHTADGVQASLRRRLVEQPAWARGPSSPSGRDGLRSAEAGALATLSRHLDKSASRRSSAPA